MRVVLIVARGRFSWSWNIWSVGMYVVPLVLVVRIMIGGTFHPLVRSSLRSDVYLVVFC